uniref:Uncharacterized protein n=1 Tax=Timema shepardi TaxID=629360 RepID=A0A7R9AZ65_TIMSH|nr:unnamed protein product [Timema shepardi]
MSTILDKIAGIEAEMARTQKNKATAGHLGLLKARLAKLRRELITPKGGGGGTGEGFDVAKTGDARIGFVGFPSVGKSTLLSTLAGVYSEVAAYEFTTLTTVPGCIKYKGAKIQAKAIVEHYSRSPSTRKRLHTVMEEMVLPVLELIQFVDTRWSSEYNMLSRLHAVRKAVGAELANSENNIEILTEVEWKQAAGIVEVLGPLADATKEINKALKSRFSFYDSDPIFCPSMLCDPRFRGVLIDDMVAVNTLAIEVKKLSDKSSLEPNVKDEHPSCSSSSSGLWSSFDSIPNTTQPAIDNNSEVKDYLNEPRLLDLPGIIEGAKDGKGRGRQVIAVARTCSLIFIVLDVLKPLQHKKLIEHELEGFGLRLNKVPPNIVFRKKDKGGVNLQTMVPQTELDLDTVKTILSEYRMHNADITLRYDASSDDLIDVIEGNRIYIPCIYLLNKIDQISIEELDIIYKIPHCVPISAHHKWNFDDLLEKIYTKPKGQLPDYESPVVLHSDRVSVEDFCNKLHRTISKEFKYALVWGSSVKHLPQKVGKDHILHDEDVVQIVKRV